MRNCKYLTGNDKRVKLKYALYEKQMAPLTKDQAIADSIHRYLDEREMKIRQDTGLDYTIAGNDGDLVVRYITQVKRTGTLTEPAGNL
jgi:hypothetical protein